MNYSLVEGISYKGDWGVTNSFQIINALGQINGLSLYDKLKINNLIGKDIIEKFNFIEKKDCTIRSIKEIEFFLCNFNKAIKSFKI